MYYIDKIDAARESYTVGEMRFGVGEDFGGTRVESDMEPANTRRLLTDEGAAVLV